MEKDNKYLTEQKLCRLILKEIKSASKELKEKNQVNVPISITEHTMDNGVFQTDVKLGEITHITQFKKSDVLRLCNMVLNSSGVRGAMIYNTKGIFQNITLYGKPVKEFVRLAHYIKKHKGFELNPNGVFSKEYVTGEKKYLCLDSDTCSQLHQILKRLNKTHTSWVVSVTDETNNGGEYHSLSIRTI